MTKKSKSTASASHKRQAGAHATPIHQACSELSAVLSQVEKNLQKFAQRYLPILKKYSTTEKISGSVLKSLHRQKTWQQLTETPLVKRLRRQTRDYGAQLAAKLGIPTHADVVHLRREIQQLEEKLTRLEGRRPPHASKSTSHASHAKELN